MPHVEVAASALGPQVIAILRKIRVSGACEEARGVIDGFTGRIRRQRRQPGRESLLESGLHRMVCRISTRFETVDVVEPRVRTWVAAPGSAAVG